ncbi:hypothetical protein CRYUN_Cryun30bG0007500 [Craigia yunnanensis]
MFGTYSSGQSLPWLWIIEYISSFPQIDTSIISGLIEAAPVLPDDLGKNTSERVALKCLEELFARKNSLGNVAPPDSRVSFDLSSSCEDVLEHILQEVPFLNLKNAGPELLRWDVEPFIMHKRASLPKCVLEQFKDSILEKNHVLDGDEEIVGIDECGHLEEETSMRGTVDVQGENNEEKEKVVLGDRYMREHEKEELPAKLKSSSLPPAPLLSRKRIKWTNEEEDMLRKGVEKFAKGGKNIPWKKILKLGTGVFLESRTTAVLRDKWKNISKKSKQGDVTAK